jgi:hypothetical protein
MSWRHNIKCCRFQRLFIRKATWIRCSWWKIYQMMIAHVIYTAIQHITPSGVLRHVESRLIAALGAYIRKADSLCTTIWSSDSICSDSSYRSIGSSKTYSADSLCTSTVSTVARLYAPFGVSPHWKVIWTLTHREILWCRKKSSLMTPTIFL